MLRKLLTIFSKAFYLTIGFFLSIPNSSYAAIWDRRSDVFISKPAGGEYLPSFNVDADTTIETSFLFEKVIPFLIKYAMRLAVALSVAAIIWGGYLYIVSFGDTEQHKNAQKTITWALIGLVLAISAYTIIRIVTNLQLTI